MKSILEELRKLNEAEEISLDTYRRALENSLDYQLEYSNLEEAIEYGDDIDLTDYRLATGQIVKKYDNIMICTADEFNEILSAACSEYLASTLNAWIEDYFDRNAFEQDLKTDKQLSLEVLKQNDITSWEAVDVDGKPYVLMEY